MTAELLRKKDDKSLAALSIIDNRLNQPPANILVVGCGTGREAGVFARHYGTQAIGIDIGTALDFDHAESAPAILKIMDAQAMEFPDSSFDLVYSFHALEHIPKPEVALAEMARVLRPGGTYFVGTPNKSRLLGYIGSATSIKNKISWNIQDLSMRLTGKWSNEKGAHAGFTRRKLSELCKHAFGDSRDVSHEYYRNLYARHSTTLAFAERMFIDHLIMPCVYVVGTKQGES